MKKILLTGATGGLGRCIANEVIEEKIGNLVCIYRNQEKFDKIFQENSHKIEKYHLAQEDDFSELIKMIDANKNDCIILILNAFSILPIKRIGSLSKNEILQSVCGNVIQNFLLVNKVIEYCQKNSISLRIINIDSGAADFPLTGWGNYCASKAFINSMLSVIALENPDYQIVSFDPGVMDTDMQSAIRAVDREIFDQVETFIGYKTDGRLNTPYDVAKQIKERYLCDWLAKNMREKYEP
ncbi:MAG: SDR family NAD(P)-dependent oxidoreductase [Lachnospiraceae bacterium]|nr:SDR family NAD(P)-dependent oxidoreductase [Lachnospiraceae bacterium]